MKKTRILALILMFAMLIQIMPTTTLGVSAASDNDTIVLYPEYPEKIERDYMYRIYVKQGDGNFAEIPVYNSMKHPNYHVRDQYGTYSEDRRFCQFSADPTKDNPVIIKVVANTNFSKVSIIPSAKGITPIISKNEITFNITESGQYMVRLSDNNLTNLAIFADGVETHTSVNALANDKKTEGYTVVRYNASNSAPNEVSQTGKIFYIIEGWQDVEFFELNSNQQLYIAPGAVLNSRVRVLAGQQNVTISGRGMLRDFNDSRANNKSYEQINKRGYYYLLSIGTAWPGLDAVQNSTQSVRNVNVKDIILYDATGFNLIFQGSVDCTADNIKILSNEISTDGVSLFCAYNTTVKNSYIHNADNIFVIDQAYTLTLDNLLLGSTVATFFPQSEFRGTHKYTNINIFRSATIFEPTGGFTRPKGESDEVVLIENLSAIDCVAPVDGTATSKTGRLFSTYSSWGAADKKNVTFRNVSLPSGTTPRTIAIANKGSGNTSAGNYNIVLENVYADNGSGGFDLLVYDASNTANNNVTFTNNSTNANASTLTAGANSNYSYTPIKRNVTTANYTATQAYIGTSDYTSLPYFSLTAPYVNRENNISYVSAKTTAEKLGFNTYFDADDKSLTIYDEDVLLRVTAGSDMAVYNDDDTVQLSGEVEYKDEIMVPIDFFSKTLGISATASGNKIVIGNYDRAEDLAIDGDFESDDSLENWDTINFTALTLDTEGTNQVLRFFDQNLFLREYTDSNGKHVDVRKDVYDHQGVYQDVHDVLLQNGAGVYEITFKAKCNEQSIDLTTTTTDSDGETTKDYYIFGTIGTGWMSAGTLGQATAQDLTTSWKKYSQQITVIPSGTAPTLWNKALYLAIIVKGGVDVSIDDITFTKISDVPSASQTNTLSVSGNSVSYGTPKTVTVSGTNARTVTLSTTSDYITVTKSTTSTSGTVTVNYPSNYARTARIDAKNSSGTVVGSITITIPGTTTDKHVVDFDTDLSIKESYEVGDTLDISNFNLTNVLYNDGTNGTVSGSEATVTVPDFSTEGRKTIAVTYDNKTVTYTTKVGDVGTEEPEPDEPDVPTVMYEEKKVELTDANVSFEKYFPASNYRGDTNEFKNPDRLFDGEQSSYGYYAPWKQDITQLDHYLEVIVDLGEEKDISSVNVYAGSASYNYPSPVNAEILVAGKDDVYTSVYNYSGTTRETTRFDCAVLDHTTTGADVRYIKYRYDTIIFCSAIAEIEVYEMIALGGEDPDVPTEPEDPILPEEPLLTKLGASIRLADDNHTAGLRFAATIAKNELYDKYYPTIDESKSYKYSDANNYQFGTIIIPEKLIPEDQNVISVFMNEETKANVLEIVGKGIWEQDAESLTFTGVVVDIPETKNNYTTKLQAAFYVRVRDSATDEWEYYFSDADDIVTHSYYSVAVEAAEAAYNYSKIPNPTEEEKAMIDALNEIIEFVEKDNWITDKWW